MSGAFAASPFLYPCLGAVHVALYASASSPKARAYAGVVPVVAWCSALRCSMPLECAVGRVVVVPWWSQSWHRQTTVSTEAIASMLITSVAGRQTVTVLVAGSFPERR